MSQYYISETGSSVIDVETLTGNTGGPVGADAAGNINTVGTGSITISGNAGTNTLTTALTGLTNHSVLVGAGTATITSLAVGTTGQVLTGATGADPAFAAIGTNSALTSHGVLIAQGNAPFVTSTSIVAGEVLTSGTGVDPFFAGVGTNSSFQINTVILGNNNDPWFATNQGTDGQVLIAANGAPPAFASITAGTNITLSPGTNSLTISASQAPLINNYTAVSTSPYVVLSTDNYLSVDTTAARTIQLPNSTTTRRLFTVKDRTGSAAANNITVTTVGGIVLIDGSASQIISNNYGAINILFNGSTYEVY